MMINKVLLNDIDCVMSLISDVIKAMEGKGIFQWDETYPDKTVMLDDISSGSLYAARIDNNITGIVTLNERQSPEYQDIHWSDKEGKPLIIHRLCIHPNFQGQGLAKLLMNFAETYAREKKHDSIRLDAFINNKTAIQLYDSLHYERKGIVKFRKGNFYCYEKKL